MGQRLLALILLHAGCTRVVGECPYLGLLEFRGGLMFKVESSSLNPTVGAQVLPHRLGKVG